MTFSNIRLNFPDSGLLTLDVPPDLTLKDLQALIESETGAPADIQTFEKDGQPVTDVSKTLRDLSVNHNDILGLRVTQPEQQQAQQSGGQARGDRMDPETIRQQILNNATVRENLRRDAPALVEAASDPARFRSLLAERERQMRQAQRQAMEEIERLDNDIDNPDSQAEIMRRIRQQQIDKNLERAMEENPESFGRVNMLYIDVMVNNVPIKAFVDSGAQTTIMSPSAAENCNITHLIDERHGGIARGVGTAKILGRVHHAIMQIGGYEAASSFTVMEGKDVDLLLGLDMLKRHQMCIDLKKNCLRVHDTEIEFLPEHQLPKMMEEVLANEPKVEGPGGSTIGATTGTLLPGPQAGEASQPKPETQGASTTSATTSAAPTTPAAQASTATTQPQTQSSASDQITEEKIRVVMQYANCGRQQAIGLLQAAGGNPDVAIGLMFG